MDKIKHKNCKDCGKSSKDTQFSKFSKILASGERQYYYKDRCKSCILGRRDKKEGRVIKRYKKYTQKDIELIRSDKYSTKELVTKFGYSKRTIYKYRNSTQEVLNNDKRTPTNRDKTFFIDETKSIEDIAIETKFSKTKIKWLAKLWNIERLLPEKVPDNPINLNFFKTWSDDMAYVLGFIASDGCVSQDFWGNPTEIKIGLSSKDVDVLEKIKNMVNSNCKISKAIRNGYEYVFFSIARKSMAQDINSLGITPKKSLTLKFPKIPQSHIKSFILGYFDGDGSVWESHNQISVSFTGTKEFLEVVRAYILREGYLKGHLGKHKSAPSGLTYRLCYHGNKGPMEILDWLYENSVESRRMNRKYDKYIFLKNKYNRHL